ncbi:MAG TPA: NAD-dependent epimerase/dehydratase family protein [Methylomirabilota bacterium]|nr:NAD-dependent epimerase/dehydratase family protein [Methylomirabilota bacterium]
MTGSTGFIGARLCERLTVDYKLAYRALVRDFGRAPRIARLAADMVRGDIDDFESLDRALDGCDTVVHLAYSDGPQTRRLLRVCRKRGIQRFVHMSSIAVHGANPGPQCAREETASISRHYPGEEYSNMKAAAERAVQAAMGQGLRAVILRPTIVYGPYGPFVTSIVDAAREGGLLTLLDEGRGVCNSVYVDDVCDAIRAAIENDRALGSAFFVTADRAVTWREFNLAFAEMVVPAPRIVSVRSDEVRRYWASQRPTLKANLAAAGRLAASAAFHRQLATVPVFGSLITGGKQIVKSVLSSDRLATLKNLRSTPARGDGNPDPGIAWPDMGRVTRECLSIAFSNERARTVLGWRPRYDLQAGAALTRTWLEFAKALTLDA